MAVDLKFKHHFTCIVSGPDRIGQVVIYLASSATSRFSVYGTGF